jgi:hypothetical protein
MQPVFVDSVDRSIPSAPSVLPNVIEESARTAVPRGGVDFVLIAEATGMILLPRCRRSVDANGVLDAGLFYTISIQYVDLNICYMGPDGSCGECLEI